MEMVGVLSKEGCEINIHNILYCILNLHMRKLRLGYLNQ